VSALLAKSGGLVRSLDGRSLVAGTAQCRAACCGVPGFRRAVPCQAGVGCGGGDEGVPVFVAIGARCVGGSPILPGMVIGWNQACFEVEQDPVYRLCDGSSPPPGFGEQCIPDGSEVIPPGLALPCFADCQAAACVPSQARWIPLRACDPSSLPPGTPTPVIDAAQLPAGCAVGSDGTGRCWIADCRGVVVGPIPPDAIVINLQSYFRSCCECQCGGGQYATLGCEEHFGFGGLNRCCCPFPLNPGTSMAWTIHEVTGPIYTGPGYIAIETVTDSGTVVVMPDGTVSGGGTRRIELRYTGQVCTQGLPTCPPSGCVEVEERASFYEPTCPPPLWDARPCPPSAGGPPNVTWTGSVTCNRSQSRKTTVIPGAVCEGGYTTTRYADFRLTGVNYAGCSGGCDGARLNPIDIGDIEDLL
jgi:hypothetical protein